MVNKNVLSASLNKTFPSYLSKMRGSWVHQFKDYSYKLTPRDLWCISCQALFVIQFGGFWGCFFNFYKLKGFGSGFFNFDSLEGLGDVLGVMSLIFTIWRFWVMIWVLCL